MSQEIETEVIDITPNETCASSNCCAWVVDETGGHFECDGTCRTLSFEVEQPLPN